MEVWVRSQDKMSFMKIEHISADEIIVHSRKTKWCVTVNFGCIGEYHTKERCLEIIDEIQSRVDKYEGRIVYEMPKE